MSWFNSEKDVIKMIDEDVAEFLEAYGHRPDFLGVTLIFYEAGIPIQCVGVDNYRAPQYVVETWRIENFIVFVKTFEVEGYGSRAWEWFGRSLDLHNILEKENV